MMTICNPNLNLTLMNMNFRVQQDKNNDSELIQTESQSSDATELPTEEDIELQHNSTTHKSTGRSQELCKMMLSFCVHCK